MNRFHDVKGSEADFEQVWLSRDSHRKKVPGFVEFHLLKGPNETLARDAYLAPCDRPVTNARVVPPIGEEVRAKQLKRIGVWNSGRRSSTPSPKGT
jgi:hypothetical protein